MMLPTAEHEIRHAIKDVFDLTVDVDHEDFDYVVLKATFRLHCVWHDHHNKQAIRKRYANKWWDIVFDDPKTPGLRFVSEAFE